MTAPYGICSLCGAWGVRLWTCPQCRLRSCDDAKDALHARHYERCRQVRLDAEAARRQGRAKKGGASRTGRTAFRSLEQVALDRLIVSRLLGLDDGPEVRSSPDGASARSHQA